jgi:hypothetical protein
VVRFWRFAVGGAASSFSNMARGAVTCLIIFVVICGFLNVKGQKDIILLNEDNWTDTLKNEWMVEL